MNAARIARSYEVKPLPRTWLRDALAGRAEAPAPVDRIGGLVAASCPAPPPPTGPVGAARLAIAARIEWDDLLAAAQHPHVAARTRLRWEHAEALARPAVDHALELHGPDALERPGFARDIGWAWALGAASAHGFRRFFAGRAFHVEAVLADRFGLPPPQPGRPCCAVAERATWTAVGVWRAVVATFEVP